MGYTISSSLRRQVQRYRFVEVLETGTGWLVLTVLTVGVGSFGPDMSAKMLWGCVALLILEALSKLLRGFIHKVYFHGMSCAQVAESQGQSYRVILRSFSVLNGMVQSTFAYVALSAFVRLCAMIAQVCLGVFLYQAIPELQSHPEYHKDWAKRRVHEVLVVICGCLLLHSFLMAILIFFGLGYSFTADCLAHLQRRCGLGRSFRACRDSEPEDCTASAPFWERLERTRAEMQMGVTWYIHFTRHFCFSAVEAHSHKDECGLPGYWFHTVKELLNMVRDNLPSLSDESSGEKRWKGAGKKMTMALASLLQLSKQRKACGCKLCASEEMMMGSHMQDLPQGRRCMHDVDAGLDFARAQGYLVMLQVMKCCPPASEDIKLAACILAGFAGGLSSLPWQPGGSPRHRGTTPVDDGSQSQHCILDMLEDDDFRYCTVDLLHDFARRLLPDDDSTAAMFPPWTDHFADRTANASPRALREAAASAISSFAEAASDIHAHYHDPRRPQTHPKGLPGRNGGRKCQDDIERGYVSRLSNGLTSLCPVGWLLEPDAPDFQRANTIWVGGVKSVLAKQQTVDALLDLAANSRNVSSNVVADSIRTLSALWSRRMICWHRFDDRLLADFPPAMAAIRELDHPEKVREKLRSLVLRCSEPQVDPRLLGGTALSAFSKLHLAKILISQDIRDVDLELTQMLLQCLCYWRRALGPRELDWFACETIETLRDLFTTSLDQSAVCTRMWDSPGGIKCLRLMLNERVSVMRSVRFFPTQPIDFDNCLLAQMTSSQEPLTMEKIWSSDVGMHISRCVAAAAGLLGEVINPREERCMLPGLTENPAFYKSLFLSLGSILNPEKWQTAAAGSSGFARPPSHMWRQWRRWLPLLHLNLTARFVLLFWESLGNPAWRPSFGFFENINSCDRAENRMENFERGVNALLGMAHAAWIAELILTHYAHLIQFDFDGPDSHHLLSSCFPPLVRLLVNPMPRLQTCLRLYKWEEKLHNEIKNRVARVVYLVLRRLYPLRSTVSSPSPSPREYSRQASGAQSKLNSSASALRSIDVALNDLQKWAVMELTDTKVEMTPHNVGVQGRSQDMTSLLYLVKELTERQSVLISSPSPAKS